MQLSVHTNWVASSPTLGRELPTYLSIMLLGLTYELLVDCTTLDCFWLHSVPRRSDTTMKRKLLSLTASCAVTCNTAYMTKRTSWCQRPHSPPPPAIHNMRGTTTTSAASRPYS